MLSPPNEERESVRCRFRLQFGGAGRLQRPFGGSVSWEIRVVVQRLRCFVGSSAEGSEDDPQQETEVSVQPPSGVDVHQQISGGHLGKSAAFLQPE